MPKLKSKGSSGESPDYGFVPGAILTPDEQFENAKQNYLRQKQRRDEATDPAVKERADRTMRYWALKINSLE